MDYGQLCINTGNRPQNYVIQHPDHCGEAALSHLHRMKNEQVNSTATPPFFVKTDLVDLDLAKLGSRFDVIYIDPPWEEYVTRCVGFPPPNGRSSSWWTPEELAGRLDIRAISDTKCFLFLWAGSGEHLQHARDLMVSWGFKRVEDIVWVKTNKSTTNNIPQVGALLRRTVEHCLVGVKGKVKRDRDLDLVHSNIDTDVILAEEKPLPSTEKPQKIYEIIERLCNGRRRIELFGSPINVRRGWVTLGTDISFTHWDPAKYNAYFVGEGGHSVGTTPEIEAARPRSPSERPHSAAQSD